MCFRFRINIHVRGNDCCWLRICSRQSNYPPRLGPQCMPRFETRCCTCTVMRFCRREVLVIHTRVVFSTIAGARQASAWTHKRVRFRGVRASSAQWTADTKWEWEPEWVAAGARSRASRCSLQRSFHSAQDQCTVFGPVLRIIALIVLSVWILDLLIATRLQLSYTTFLDCRVSARGIFGARAPDSAGKVVRRNRTPSRTRRRAVRNVRNTIAASAWRHCVFSHSISCMHVSIINTNH